MEVDRHGPKFICTCTSARPCLVSSEFLSWFTWEEQIDCLTQLKNVTLVDLKIDDRDNYNSLIPCLRYRHFYDHQIFFFLGFSKIFYFILLLLKLDFSKVNIK